MWRRWDDHSEVAEDKEDAKDIILPEMDLIYLCDMLSDNPNITLQEVFYWLAVSHYDILYEKFCEEIAEIEEEFFEETAYNDEEE